MGLIRHLSWKSYYPTAERAAGICSTSSLNTEFPILKEQYAKCAGHMTPEVGQDPQFY